MKSMTGFGQARIASAQSELDVVIRAVNGRFLEIRFHVPREMMKIESDLKALIEKYFTRGTIDIYLSRKPRADRKATKVQLNSEVVKAYQSALLKLNRQLGSQAKWHPEALIRMPEVVYFSEDQFNVDKDRKQIIEAAKIACEKCVKAKLREGVSLQKDLLKNHSELALIIQKIWKTRDAANQEIQKRMTDKIRSRVAQSELSNSIDPQRMAQEITLLLEKSDISEEVARLQEHLQQYKSMLLSQSSQGKSLDFYTQELLREVNTIGSKSHLSKLTQLVVEAKTNIERLREQVQNVE